MKSPARLAPNHNLKGANERAAQVIAAMAEQGHITEAMAKLALANPGAGLSRQGRRLDQLRRRLRDGHARRHRRRHRRGHRRDTTLDPKMQASAERALSDELNAKGDKFGVEQGALVALDPDGGVKALVGGRNYADSQFNRAIAAKRQPGSAFKPFVYLAALEKGLRPDTVREDAPISVKGWSPENYSREYFGPVTLTKALSLSLNTVAVRLGLEVGPKTVARTAHRLGIASDLEPNASIALGTSEVSPLELVGAYAAFANGGIGVQPHVIQRVRTAEGKLVYQRRNANNGRVIEPQYVAMMNQMMEETLLTGTARKAELPGWQAAGKTGTSQDWRDAWFVGYTSYLVAGVGSATTTVRRPRKSPAETCRSRSGAASCSDAHQGVPPAGLPLGDWRGEEPPPAPTFNDPGVGPPLTINKSGVVGRAPLTVAPAAVSAPPAAPPPAPAPSHRAGPAPGEDIPIPPAPIPNAGGDPSSPPSRGGRNLLSKLLGAT